MPNSGPRKATIDKSNLPPVIKLGTDSYGYLTRYRIISEDRNRFSHWSPIFATPAFDLNSLPPSVQGFLTIPSTENGLITIGGSAILSWEELSGVSGYDIFVQFTFDIVEKSAENNVATLFVNPLTKHNLKVGDRVLVDINDERFDGEHIISSIPNNFSFSYNSEGANLATLETSGFVVGPFDYQSTSQTNNKALLGNPLRISAIAVQIESIDKERTPALTIFEIYSNIED
jgi:hypothetical protein